MFKKISLILLCLLFICTFFYATNIEPGKLVVKEQTLYLPHWNKQLNGLKIGVISDIHAFYGKTDNEKLNKIIQKTNERNPDLILILGDFDAIPMSKSQDRQKNLSSILKELKAPYGVFSILGNHDYEPANIVKNVLHNANILVLENQTKSLKIKNQIVNIVGLKDLWHDEILATELEEILKDKPSPIIVLSHNPDIFPAIPEKVSLTLSGHTHGGEVYLPFLGAPMVPSDYAQRFRKGHIVENGKHLFVTSGIGTLSGFRLLNPPEIIILRLYSQSEDTKILNTKRLTGVHKNYIPLYTKIKSMFINY